MKKKCVLICEIRCWYNRWQSISPKFWWKIPGRASGNSLGSSLASASLPRQDVLVFSTDYFQLLKNRYKTHWNKGCFAYVAHFGFWQNGHLIKINHDIDKLATLSIINHQCPWSHRVQTSNLAVCSENYSSYLKTGCRPTRTHKKFVKLQVMWIVCNRQIFHEKKIRKFDKTMKDWPTGQTAKIPMLTRGHTLRWRRNT